MSLVLELVGVWLLFSNLFHFGFFYFENMVKLAEKNDNDDEGSKEGWRILKDEILLVLHKKATRRKRGVRRIQIK